MNRYECPYVSDGVEYSAVVWAASETEAAARMRALPWQPGNGPVCRPRGDNRSTPLHAFLLLLALGAAATTALTFRQADTELKQMATLMHFQNAAYPHASGKIGHRA